MSDIKVIEGLEPWEVMKRASEGEDVACRDTPEWKGDRVTSWIKALPAWDFPRWEYAIIDTTTPEIDLDGFDLNFFIPYGGLHVEFEGVNQQQIKWPSDMLLHGEFVTLLESPFYYWAGGEQPVPDNIEVEVAFRDTARLNEIVTAWDIVRWNWSDNGDDIIGFKLTGRVL